LAVVTDKHPPAKRPGYEQARDQLVELVKRLEAGGLTLEQSLELWEQGERLAAICEEWLEGARARLAAAASRQAADEATDDGVDDDAAAPFRSWSSTTMITNCRQEVKAAARIRSDRNE